MLLLALWDAHTFLVLMTLTVLESNDHVICRKSLKLDAFVIFLTVRFFSWLLVFRKVTEVKGIFITTYQGCMLSIWHHCWCKSLDFNHLDEVGCVRFLHFTNNIFPFPHCTLWEKLIMDSWPLRGAELSSTSLGMGYLDKLFGILLHMMVIYFFNHLFTSVWTNKKLFYALG